MNFALRLAAFFCVLMGAGAQFAFANSEPLNVARGFQPQKSFSLGDIDHVNGLNGNLILTVPIGQRYTVSPQLSYQFMLTWNSNVWDGDEGSVQESTASFLNRTSNAGVGWQFGLGRLIQPGQFGNKQASPIYLAPDGSRSVFFETIKPGAQDSDPGVLYTRDSKYLRLRNLGSCAGFPWTGQCKYEVDFPSGLVHQFRQADGQLTSITDRFGNAVTVDYDPSGSSWTVNDGFRSHTIALEVHDYDDPGQAYLVSSVTLAAFGANGAATYVFSYVDTTLPRPGSSDPAQSAHPNPNAPLLSAISGPEGWLMSMPIYQLDDLGAGKLAGTLNKLVIPTGGAIEWDYQMYNFASDSDSRPFLTTSAGVKQRRMRAADNSVIGTWEYLVEQPGLGRRCTGFPDLPLPTLKRDTIDPLGHTSRKFFTVWPCLGFPGEPDMGEYGLPYDKGSIDPASGAYLSEEIFDCDVRLAGCSNPLRRIYVKYDRDNYPNDPQGNPVQPSEIGESMSQRLAYQKVVFVDDLNHFKETTWSTYSGFGHYYRKTLNGNFDSGNIQTTTTTWAPKAALTPSPIWLLNLYSEVQEDDGVSSSLTKYSFNLNTGFLDCVRTGPGFGTDLLTRYTPNQAGFVVQERYFGGDRTPIGTTGSCNDGSSAEYTIDHTYQSGSLASSKYSSQSWKLVDQTIDAHTGLASASFDTSGMQTTFLYDLLGRLTEERPLAKSGFAREAWTHVSYVFSSRSKVDVVKCAPAATLTTCNSTPLAAESYTVDDFGRPFRAKRLHPNGLWTAQRFEHDGVGNRTKSSTIALETAATWYYTVSNGFDPFGRPQTTTAPDGSVTSFARLGERVVETTESIALGLNGTESAVTRRETFDRQGRLFRVEEQSDNSDPSSYVKTDYSYNHEGRLKKVCQAPSGTSCGQTRIFNYDGRGFLTTDHPPELTGNPNYAFVYYCYDSRGHAGQKRIPGTTSVSAFFYDSAERLTHVRLRTSPNINVCSDVSGAILKQFTYDTAVGAGAGKLQEAIRRNDLPAPWSTNYQVTETYRYSEQVGRLSRRTTSLSVGGVQKESWSFNVGYHDLGLIDAFDYPVCTGTGCTVGSAAPYSVLYTYTNGVLSAIPNWTKNSASPPIDYWPSLLPNTVTHANNVTETISNDPSRMLRPGSMTVSRQNTTLWSSGTYSYDGSGNIKGIGADQYSYDRVSRLVTSSLASSAPGRSQSYGFDIYGNLVSKTTDGNALTIPVSSTTNRMLGASTYDLAGNQTSYNGNGYTYDVANSMTALCTGSADVTNCPSTADLWAYVYTADDERVLSLRRAGTAGTSDLNESWTIRDIENRVLRRDEWTPTGGVSLETIDYIWRGEQLFGSRTNGGSPKHFALDHLGSVRSVTNNSGASLALHAYFPFGEEATATSQDSERMKFAGHERDLKSSSSNTADDLDYLHQRYESPLVGRFLSIDPIGLADLERGDPDDYSRFLANLRSPQTLNLYAYANGNPMKYVDPNGESAELAISLPLLSSGASATAVATATAVGGSVALAAASGYGLGTLINKVPGVSEGTQKILGWAIDQVMFAQNTNHTKDVLEGSFNGAEANFVKMMNAGGPGKDPNERKHKSEIKAWLKKATRQAKRLPTKLREAGLARVKEFAAKSGVTL